MRDAAERTRLAWERSSLAPLATAALLLARHLHPLFAEVLLAVANLVLAAVVIASGWRRSRRIRASDAGPDGRTTIPDAGRELIGTAVAATTVAFGTAVLIALGT